MIVIGVFITPTLHWAEQILQTASAKFQVGTRSRQCRVKLLKHCLILPGIFGLQSFQIYQFPSNRRKTANNTFRSPNFLSTNSPMDSISMRVSLMSKTMMEGVSIDFRFLFGKQLIRLSHLMRPFAIQVRYFTKRKMYR